MKVRVGMTVILDDKDIPTEYMKEYPVFTVKELPNENNKVFVSWQDKELNYCEGCFFINVSKIKIPCFIFR